MFTSQDYDLYEDNYDFRLIAPHTWMFGTKGLEYPYSSDCYLLEGEEKAVMIDSGMNPLNLKTYIDELKLTDKPIIGVINTHSHFDHTGGNGFFGHAFMHPLAQKGATTPFGKQIGDEPETGYILDYPITFIHEGDKIDLGGRELEILEIGAHDLSSIAILDHGQRILFTGDELETGWCGVGGGGMGSAGDKLHGPEKAGRTIESHYKNMQKLKARYDEYDILCPGHHGAPIAKETIEHHLTCDKMILDGVEGDPYIPRKHGGGSRAFPSTARVMRYKSAHICYDTGWVWEDK